MKLTHAMLAAGLLSAASFAVQAQTLSLDYIGQQIVATGTQFNGTTVGGLSSLDFNAATGRYLAISDDRSALNPARFYELSLDLAQFQRSANPGAAGVLFNAVTTIQAPGGGSYAINTVDPEGLRYNPTTGTIFWSNEGQRSAAGFQNPTVREMSTTGAHLRDLSVPTYYNPVGSNASPVAASGDKGIYNNLAFESVALSANGQTVYVATENGLTQDGLPTNVLTGGSKARILALDAVSGAAVGEYVYVTEGIAETPNPITGFATNGLTDLLALDEPGRFIGIERSFSVGVAGTGNRIKLYEIDLAGATNVLGTETLGNVVAAKKTLLLDLSTLRNDDGSELALDNIEGLTFARNAQGERVLVLVSDNNFSGTQFTQFIALSVSAVPEPGTLAMLAGGLGVMMTRVVRSRRRPVGQAS